MAGLRGELLTCWARYRSAIIAIGLLGAVLNVLLLGGSIYLMMIYDSVLPGRSIPTLFGLFAMVTAVYAFQAAFEHYRQQILSTLGTELDKALATKVQRIIGTLAMRGGRAGADGLMPMRDLDSVRSFLTGSGPAVLLDLPWIVFFLGILTVLHFWLGIVALAGSVVMIALTVATNRLARQPALALAGAAAARAGLAESNLRHVETLTAMGMREAMHERWNQANGEWLSAQDSLSRTANHFGLASKVFRMFLQSAILTVGALLVIDGKASAGVIFAASLISGRALAPVDQAIANWKSYSSARDGWFRLRELLGSVPPDAMPDVRLPLPSRSLSAEGLGVSPPGQQRPTVTGISFSVAAGEAIGVIGPSGAGKSTLARALLGLWPARIGSVRLDNAAIEQWHSEILGSAVGYVSQAVDLFEGTVAQNIARFSPHQISSKVIAAAKDAGAHDLIVGLPEGYDTPVGRDGVGLSAGQRQRIALARALYDKPFLVVLDEPNSNLDQAGELALNTAIAAARARGAIVVVIAHRPSLLSQVSHVMFIRNGRMEAFGPRDDVLRQVSPANVTANLPARAVEPIRG